MGTRKRFAIGVDATIGKYPGSKPKAKPDDEERIHSAWDAWWLTYWEARDKGMTHAQALKEVKNEECRKAIHMHIVGADARVKPPEDPYG